MASEIKSAAEATKIATTFLKDYYGFLRPISALRKDGIWVVTVDVGLVSLHIAEVKIDAMTGTVMEYFVPRLEE